MTRAGGWRGGGGTTRPTGLHGCRRSENAPFTLRSQGRQVSEENRRGEAGKEGRREGGGRRRRRRRVRHECVSAVARAEDDTEGRVKRENLRNGRW